MYDEILQAIIAMASAAVNVQIVTGSMPPNNGIAMTGTSGPETIFLDIGNNERMSIICNGKNTSQATIIKKMDTIHAALTRRKDFPQGESWQIYSIETIASPRLIGREENSQWLYASSLLVKFNTKGI